MARSKRVSASDSLLFLGTSSDNENRKKYAAGKLSWLFYPCPPPPLRNRGSATDGNAYQPPTQHKSIPDFNHLCPEHPTQYKRCDLPL